MSEFVPICPYLLESDSSSKIFFSYRGVDLYFPLHGHDFYELELVISGSGRQWINNVCVPIQKGSLYLLSLSDVHRMEADEDTYISLRRSIEASRKGNYVFHYHAPVLIVAANRRGYGNALADSACVLENMMIAANALDLGSCWINQLHWLDGDSAVRACLEGLGLGKDETVTGGLILGLGESGMPVRGVRQMTGNPVTWIEEE